MFQVGFRVIIQVTGISMKLQKIKENGVSIVTKAFHQFVFANVFRLLNRSSFRNYYKVADVYGFVKESSVFIGIEAYYSFLFKNLYIAIRLQYITVLQHFHNLADFETNTQRGIEWYWYSRPITFPFFYGLSKMSHLILHLDTTQQEMRIKLVYGKRKIICIFLPISF